MSEAKPPTTPDGKAIGRQGNLSGQVCGLDGCTLPAWHLGVCAVNIGHSRSRTKCITYSDAVYTKAGRKQAAANSKPDRPALCNKSKQQASTSCPDATKDQPSKKAAVSSKPKQTSFPDDGAKGQQLSTEAVVVSKPAQKVDLFAFDAEDNKTAVKPQKATKRKSDPFAFSDESCDYAKLSRQRRARLFAH